MQYFLSRGFQKQFKKLPARAKQKAIARLQLFVANPMDYRLRNHPLAGEWREHRSINITGDYRAVYKREGDTVIFITIGTHSELY